MATEPGIPARAPSRQTGAICIRHYDDGRNPYTEPLAPGRPMGQPLPRERFLLQHIASSRAAEERKRAANTFEDSAAGKRIEERLHQLRPIDSRLPSSDALHSEASEDPLVGPGGAPNTPKSHVAILQAHLNHLDQQLWGHSQMVHDNGNALDGVMYLEWELACARHNEGGAWAEAVSAGIDIVVCGASVPCALLLNIMRADGVVPLHPLLKGMYSNLTDEQLERLVAAADKQRPIPLVFSSARALHRYYADVVKRFSKSMKVSKRSGKVGLDRHEFRIFCHSVRVMGEKEALRVFDEVAVEAANGAVGRVLTADEFAALYNV